MSFPPLHHFAEILQGHRGLFLLAILADLLLAFLLGLLEADGTDGKMLGDYVLTNDSVSAKDPTMKRAFEHTELLDDRSTRRERYNCLPSEDL